ncbi:MAG: hypothetical protein WCJ95_09590 [Mariniphaga sp.]
MKIYDILELQRLDLVDLSFTADDFGVDFRGKAKQQLIYLILDAQEKMSELKIDHA